MSYIYEDPYEQRDEVFLGDDRDYHEYCERPFDVQCDVCQVMDRAAQILLESKGWVLRNGEFCPSH